MARRLTFPDTEDASRRRAARKGELLAGEAQPWDALASVAKPQVMLGAPA